MRWGEAVRSGTRLRQIALAGAVVVSSAGWQVSAFAGSDHSSDTYAGDVNALVLPPGTVVATQYLGYRQGDQYNTSNANIFSKLTGGVHEIPSSVELFTSTSRLSYFTQLWGRPLVFEAAVSFAGSRDFNIGDLPTPVGGLGPQTVMSSLLDPVLLVSYGLIVDPRQGQFLALTNHLYLPSGNYDKFSQINFSASDMYTWVPQVTYAGRLAQLGSVSLWMDLIANASIHSTGSSPLALAPGVQFDRLTQANSYDVKAYLRYEFMPLGHLALGIERSWGGNQVASGGALEAIFGGPTSFGKDDFTKGHLQLAFPLSRDFQVAADISHDFQREGGVREDFVAEIRFTKLFAPSRE
jgi:hypothetical protein